MHTRTPSWKRALLAPFVLAAWAFSHVRRAIMQAVIKLDPYEDVRTVAWSHVQRAGFRLGWAPIVAALVAVAVPLLPAGAVPIYFTGAKTTVTMFGKLGALSSLSGFVGAQQQVRKAPFRYGTVARRQTIGGNIAWTFGQAIPTIVVPQVGMFSKVFVDLELAYTVATAPLVVATLDGFDAILQRARVGLNNGSANLVDLSGVGVKIINKNESYGTPIKRGLGLALGAQTAAYKFQLPINANNRRQFEMGLINLQAPELRANIDLVFAPLANVFTVPANFTVPTLTARVSYLYWEIPDPTKYDLPPLTVVRSIEEAPIAVQATGDQVYQLPRLGTMFEYHAVAVFNNLYVNLQATGPAAAPAITNFAWRYNLTDTPFSVTSQDWEMIEAGFTDDPGLTFLDNSTISFFLWAADNRNRNGGDFRDAIDTEQNTTTQSIVTVNPAQALNAGKDNLFHVRRVVQRIVQAPVPTAG
jgi:hypothetical protein